ncbi:Glycosyl transferase, group 2 family protein [Fulvivirga imtechensis AK7]|uniref:Glycosyl transferase, group 2 family protein n=1 Tax=Fulvivirga imtechensis AK7 TaxID=1237149 RepID=L8JQY4_9BACT|nr:glycosyltransferase family 2 protein [Fulvivirga imtechensis]ELR71255.1 Glycosyl transferase, group 2 family protein [Fulvivirga imtechensis AK7]
MSIVVPCFNREKYIRETLDSIHNQTYHNWEAIVVDDGSSDGSVNVINEYVNKDSRFRLLHRSRTPKGAAVCRNEGITVAQGDFIMFLDSDDLLAEWCLEQRMKIMSECTEQWDFLVFPSLLFKEVYDDMRILADVGTEEKDIYRILRLEVPWTISGPIWKKQSLRSLGGFDENLSAKQDPDLIIRAVLSGLSYKRFLEVRPDVFYRQHQDGRVSSLDDLGNKKIVFNNIRKLICKTSGLLQESKYNNDLLVFRALGNALITNIFNALFSHLHNEAIKFLKLGDTLNLFSRFDCKLIYFLIRLDGLGGKSIPGYYRIMRLFLWKYSAPNHWARFTYTGPLNAQK